MKLQVLSTQVFERNITAKNGKPYKFREQEAVVEMGPERRIIVVSLDDSQAAYPVGAYEVLDSSFDVDRNRNLSLKRRLSLKPLASVGAAPGRTGTAG